MSVEEEKDGVWGWVWVWIWWRVRMEDKWCREVMDMTCRHTINPSLWRLGSIPQGWWWKQHLIVTKYLMELSGPHFCHYERECLDWVKNIIGKKSQGPKKDKANGEGWGVKEFCKPLGGLNSHQLDNSPKMVSSDIWEKIKVWGWEIRRVFVSLEVHADGGALLMVILLKTMWNHCWWTDRRVIDVTEECDSC